MSGNRTMLSFLRNGYVQVVIIVITLFLYLLTKNIFFGILVALEIFGFVALEIKSGVKSHGWFNEIKETVIALVVALVLWGAAIFILNTTSPISAVASCSMLPALDRGDFVIVQGSEITAYTFSLTPEEFQELLAPSVIGNRSFVGSVYSYCTQFKDQFCSEWATQPDKFIEKRGPLLFHYSICAIKYNDGKIISEPCVTSVEFKSKNYTINTAFDIIVYQPTYGEIYSLIGDIVHRTKFKLDVNGEIYYLTKGDNNPIFDIQVFDYTKKMGNLPISEDRLKGKIIGRIPFLGYLKLFISGLFTEPAQCKTQLIY